MLLQLITAVGALLGTFVSLLAEGMGKKYIMTTHLNRYQILVHIPYNFILYVLGDLATKWILPFTAGGFIYIATVSVIPELLTATKLWQSVMEISALLFGVYMMVLIADFE